MGNTTKQITARARARAASSRFYELERQRELVTSRYFDAMDAVDKINEIRDRAIAKAHEQAERAAEDARAAADGAIRDLFELSVTKPEIAVRLGCAAADVRRALADPDKAEPHPSDADSPPEAEVAHEAEAGDREDAVEPAADERSESAEFVMQG